MSNRVLIAVALALALGLAGGIFAAKKTGGFFNVRQIASDNGILRVSVDDLPGLRLKAEGGDAKAQTVLGIMYAYGRVVPLDYTKARLWLEKAATGGSRTAQYHLAGMYKDGRGVPTDFEKSVYWMRKAAKNGHFRAPYFVAMAYESGRGVPKSEHLADKWYRKAAEAAMEAEKGKHAEAARQLAFLYMEGNGGLPLDEQLAVEWMRKAAERGDPVAQKVLPNFEMAANLSKTVRETKLTLDSMSKPALQALKSRLTPELTPPGILELFTARPQHEYSKEPGAYDASKDTNSIEFLRALTDHVKSRDPVADAERALGKNMPGIYVLHGNPAALYNLVDTIPPSPDRYHWPGVTCIYRSRGLQHLDYGRYARGEGYNAEQDFINALDAYIRAYNRAIVDQPDDPYRNLCQTSETDDPK